MSIFSETWPFFHQAFNMAILGRAASPRIRETLRAPRGGHARRSALVLQCCGDVQGVAAALLGPDLG